MKRSIKTRKAKQKKDMPNMRPNCKNKFMHDQPHTPHVACAHTSDTKNFNTTESSRRTHDTHRGIIPAHALMTITRTYPLNRVWASQSGNKRQVTIHTYYNFPRKEGQATYQGISTHFTVIKICIELQREQISLHYRGEKIDAQSRKKQIRMCTELKSL